jgi:hypothetical protein
MAQSKASLIFRQMVKMRTRTRWRLLTVLSAVGPVNLFLIAVFTLHTWPDTGRLYGIASAFYCLLAIAMATLLLRNIRRLSSVATAEELARRSYGVSFKSLTAIEKDRVKQQMRHEILAAARETDEREEAMQRDSERHAFRLLRRGLPGLILVYWIVCLCLSIGPVRMGLVFSALALSGLTIVVLALPELIRIWSTPEDNGESHLVVGAPREV